jgi:hypothetical protein
VDEYLYRDTAKDRFFASVATLPLDPSSVMIRVIGGPGGLVNGDTVQLAPGKRWASLRCSAPDVIKAYNARQIPSRVDLNHMCKQ